MNKTCYDFAGRTTKTVVDYTRSDTILVTSMTYTTAGYVNTVTDPKALVNKTTYDFAGRTTKTIADYTDGTPTASSNQTTTYAYDGSDHVTLLTAVMPSGSHNQQTQYVYGTGPDADFPSDVASNDLMAYVYYPDPSTGSPSNADINENEIEYNALGEVKYMIDRTTTVHNYTFDVLGRRTSDQAQFAPGDMDFTVQRVDTAFDTAGRPYLFTNYDSITADNVINQVQRAYNGLGQLITEYQSHSGAVNTSTSPKVQYAYTEMASGVNHSRLKTITYPNGRIVRYEYSSGLDDSISRLSFLADDSSGSVGTHLEEFSYLGTSSVIQRAHPQPGVDLTYIKQGMESAGDAGDQYTGLDRFGRVIDQRWLVTSGGSHTDRFAYGYDRDSNRLYKNNLVASAQSELYHSNGSGSYDNLNRLTDFRRGTLSASGSTLDTVTTASHTQSWSLDALGNMPSVTTDGTPVSRTHDDQNQIASIGGNSTWYSYGNLAFDGTYNYTYDVYNRLITVWNSDESATIASYAYDALGRRITEAPTGSAATEVYYSASWQALEDDQSSHAKNQYVWSPVYIDALIERDRDADNDGSHTLEERLYAQQDANFNLTAITSTSGSVQERYLFDPYGARTVTDSSFTARSGNVSSYDWRYGHQGLKHDSETALITARNRAYDPILDRWIQSEPKGADYVDGDNLYIAYSGNSLRFLDPTGLN